MGVIGVLLRSHEAAPQVPFLGLSGRGCRGPHQVIKRPERRLGAVAGRDDDLLEKHGRHIASRKHAGHRGLAYSIDDDLTVFGQLNHPLEPVSVRQQAIWMNTPSSSTFFSSPVARSL